MAPNIMNLAVIPLSVAPSFFPSSFFSPLPLSVRARLLLLATSSSSLSTVWTAPCRDELVVWVPFFGGRPIRFTGPLPVTEAAAAAACCCLLRGLSKADGEALALGVGEPWERRGSASRETGEIVTGWEEVGAIRLTVKVEEGEVTEEGVIETEECKEPGCPVEFEE